MTPEPVNIEATVNSEGQDTANQEDRADIESPVKNRTKLSASQLDTVDPFAPRKGKTLKWKHVSMTLHASKREEAKKLLDGVWGQVPEKQTTAIMGPSGAGKTSLLNILAGRSATNNKVTIEADVHLDDLKVDPTDLEVRRNIAFVAQEDSLERTATPREAIRFSAKLRLPRTFADEELDQLTSRMLEELGLTHCADTIIGGGLMKGISGGEKKRTSVGVELVVKPALVFLDEPTSGLDSFSAQQLCLVLKKVANAGTSVLFTIHQPSSEIFHAFDHLILLNKGRLMYQGAVNECDRYFENRGFPAPSSFSTADWIMHVAQTNTLKELEDAHFFGYEDDSSVDKTLGREFSSISGQISVKADIDNEAAKGNHVSILTETAMLYQREAKAIVRDTSGTIARFAVTAVLSILIGTIFFGVGKAGPEVMSNVTSSFGALLVVGISSMMGAAQTELMQFPLTRPVFLREYSTNHYSVFSYFVARFSVEATMTALQSLVMCVICYFMIGFQSNFAMFFLSVYAVAMSSTAITVFLGCLFEDVNAAKEMFTLVTVPQMLFAGFFVSPDLIPEVIRWAQYLCALFYSVRILLVTEFDRDCGSEAGNVNCQSVLETIDADPDETWKYWVGLLALFFGYRFMGLFFLQRKGSKFFN